MSAATINQVCEAISWLNADTRGHRAVIEILNAAIGRLPAPVPPLEGWAPSEPWRPAEALPAPLLDVLVHVPSDIDPDGEWMLAFLGVDGRWRSASLCGDLMVTPTEWWPLPTRRGE